MRTWKLSDSKNAWYEPEDHYGNLVRTDATDEDDGFSVVVARCPPGSGAIRHAHEQHRQMFFVLEGSLRLATPADTVTLQRNEAVTFEPGEEHETHNETATDCLVMVVTVDG